MAQRTQLLRCCSRGRNASSWGNNTPQRPAAPAKKETTTTPSFSSRRASSAAVTLDTTCGEDAEKAERPQPPDQRFTQRWRAPGGRPRQHLTATACSQGRRKPAAVAAHLRDLCGHLLLLLLLLILAALSLAARRCLLVCFGRLVLGCNHVGVANHPLLPATALDAGSQLLQPLQDARRLELACGGLGSQLRGWGAAGTMFPC